jgi:hypothetical protein
MQDVLAPSQTSSLYVNTETAREILRGESSRELASTRSAIAEAAYYLSDPIDPDDRAQLLMTAQTIGERRRARAGDARAADALGLLSEAADDLERLLRGPGASSEIRIARKAVSRAIDGLARHLGIATNHLSAESLRTWRLAARRRGLPARD